MNRKINKPANSAPAALQLLFDFPVKAKYIFLALIVMVFYGNTLYNQYALDDDAVILGNAYVQKGVSGIPKIMTTDAWNSYLQQSNASDSFTGGRYRPLSLVIFAVEQSLAGNSAVVRHLVNILFFLGTVFLVFYFLSEFLFKKIPRGSDCAFIAATLFAIHPLHTEVVANAKSLDEILSLFFILLTLIFSLQYIKQKRKLFLYIAIVFFFLALLSKEYAIMLVILLPLLFYLYPAENKKSIVSYSIPYFFAAFAYFLLRVAAVGLPRSNGSIMYLSMNNQLRIDPYYLATPIQKFATEWYALGKYLFMLFVPYPLSSDYSYNAIPYHNFGYITVWLSIFAYAGIIYWGFKLLRKKDMVAFSIFFFLLMLIPVSNFLINVGAVFAERFDYHASLGFVTVISYYALRSTRKVSFIIRRVVISATLVLIIVVCGWETIKRNPVWKDDYTLFMHDVKVVPNSEFMEDGASVAYINLAMQNGYESRRTQMLDSAVSLCQMAIKRDKTFPDLFMNAGLGYYDLRNLDSAKYYWDILIQSGNPNPKINYYRLLLARTYLDEAMAVGADNPLIAIREIKKGLSEAPTNAELWYNLGKAYLAIQQNDSAQYAMAKAAEYKSAGGGQ